MWCKRKTCRSTTPIHFYGTALEPQVINALPNADGFAAYAENLVSTPSTIIDQLAESLSNMRLYFVLYGVCLKACRTALIVSNNDACSENLDHGLRIGLEAGEAAIRTSDELGSRTFDA